ncbi:hypothetical protein [Ornithinimicrobium avium]|uniref:Uncharacterized protein n=1 Tax=Ornithinimicrobium avium TaxID=2283195 RepID=A0A345NQH5_9MICO|nr:hypothetical protein [Ornithinimicrobium avium]AXH97283.1 hypothetical protein DV701_15210 [Ornithinimicrobium avium]
MSDRDVTALLDRMASATPPMDVSVPEVVTTARRRVRRRRVLSSGMTLASLVLLVAAWVGMGQGGDGLRWTQQVSPAGSWEVDEPSPVELPDGLALVGDVQPLTLSRGPGGSEASFRVDGLEETAEGRTLADGVEVYRGVRGTLVVWQARPGVHGQLHPVPAVTRGWAEVTVAGERLALVAIDDAGYEPEDVLFFDEHSLWTAKGAAVETEHLRDGRVEVTVYGIPELDVSGYTDGASLYDVDTLTVSSVDRPWWRGGGYDLATVARLPRQAVFAREVLVDGSEVVRASEPRLTSLVGGWSMVLFVSDWAGGGPESQDLVYTVEWSTDGETWHEQSPAQTRAPTPTQGRVGPGGEVTLLGTTYRVALDSHGWPELLEADGTVFLRVSDDEGPPAGDGSGMVMWRAHWWPWSDRDVVHFRLDGQPELVPGEEGRDRVTVTGPAGEVGLVAVPAGS